MFQTQAAARAPRKIAPLAAIPDTLTWDSEDTERRISVSKSLTGILLFVSGLLVAIPGSGQIGGTGSIRGVVSDPSGAVIPAASVVATNVATLVAANMPVHTQAAFRVKGLKPEWWDPFSGKRLAARAASGEGAAVALDLLPYESRVLVYSANAPAPAAASGAGTPVDLSSDWKVAFGNGRTAEMRELRSWTDTEETRFFSGQATYEKTVNLTESFVRSGGGIYLNFGAGKPAAQDRRGGAAIESPVREAAQVYVNGSPAGSVWKPPYEVDVTRLLRAGSNTIRVVVANLGINRLAGTTLPTYRLLNVRYGERFQEQDMQNVQPVPCGMLGPLTLTAR
jgi:hypothetical protein